MSIVLESLMWPQEFEEAGCPTPSSYNCMTPPIKNNSSHKQKYLRSIKTYIALSSFRILFDNLYKTITDSSIKKDVTQDQDFSTFYNLQSKFGPKKVLRKKVVC